MNADQSLQEYLLQAADEDPSLLQASPRLHFCTCPGSPVYVYVEWAGTTMCLNCGGVMPPVIQPLNTKKQRV